MNQFVVRRYVILGIMLLVAVVFLIRLFQLQVIDTRYKLSASNNVLRHETQYPARGLIYDRNGELLVFNEAAYDLQVIPRSVKEFDTTELCSILEVEKQELIKSLKKAKRYSRYKPSTVVKQISAISYARLQEKLHKFPGFFTQTRTLRQYNKKIAAHIFGYVGEVSDNTLKKDKYYRQGDYIGINGVERYYEEDLRGKKGVKIHLVDVHDNIKGSYQNGKYDTTATVGSDLTLTIDADLQAYGEYLMQNKIGSIVAIEPATGEVLSMVSAPNYDPSLLVGRVRTENYRKLQRDTLFPLYNRALMATYPPGSTFKMLQGMIGLQEGLLTPDVEYYCDNGYYYGRGKKLGCHYHDSPLPLIDAIETSCNAYFCNVFNNVISKGKYGGPKENLDNWAKHVNSFGFGKKLGIDFSTEKIGLIPTSKFYNKLYKYSWKAPTIISLSIGQGEVNVTPVQLANMTAAIANRGYYITPHIVKEIQGKDHIAEKYMVKHVTSIDTAHFTPIIEGMNQVFNGAHGTARWLKIKGIELCGKTGTSQNPHGENHSIFIAFAPKDNPQIAISVIVENGGYGSTWGAPIASLMLEKFFNDTIKNKYQENRIVNANLLDRGEKED